MIDENIADLVRKMEDEDEQGNTNISKYVKFSLRENIEKIDAYINSRHTSGATDSMGRDKPFFDIVTSARNIWYRATDIDRKNIRIKATKKGDFIKSFVATILLQDWMRRTAFGKFLNDWGRILATYGSAILKFVEKDGKLIPRAMPWSIMIIDPVNFENNVKIEKLWYTPAQLRAKKEYDQEYVEDLIEAKESRETMDGQKKDNKSDFIPLFELHGYLPLSHLTDKESDEATYVQQMHVISYIGKKDGAVDGFDDYTLYRGKEKKDPYMITHLIEEDGRSQAIGAVEHLFEPQWMVNHSMKAIKDQLDLASKLIFQTSDGNFVGQNALNSIENGDIMIHAVNAPLTQINNTSTDIGALQANQTDWKQNGMEINGINEAMTQAPKSNTAWRQTQAALAEAHSLFELMTENKGLDIEAMMTGFVIPHLKTKMDTKDEISAILEEHQITKIDSMFVPAEAVRRVNKAITNDILSKTPEDLENGNLFTPEMAEEQVAGEQEAVQNALNQFDSQRFISPDDIDDKTWKQVMKDLEWDVEVDVTGESKDVQAMMDTWSTMLQFFANKQGMPLTPEEKLVTNKIMEETGAISAIEINAAQQATQPVVPQPQVQPQPVPQIK